MTASGLHTLAIALTRELLAIRTINPPGEEKACAEYLGNMLKNAGFSIDYYEAEAGRPNLVARLSGTDDKLPICFTGHLDTVPLGNTEWRQNPFGGEIIDGKLYGRGSTDMKAGIAAMIVASLSLAKLPNRKAGLTLVITTDEENACQGAKYLAGIPDALGEAGALLVGEPTSNYPLIGEKGVFWFKAQTSGITAHGSMPEQGVNAVYEMAHVVSLLEQYKFEASHSLLGVPTLNIGTITGGQNLNSVPDKAEIAVDIRTVPGQKSDELFDALKQHLGGEVTLDIIEAADAISTAPDDPWVKDVFDVMTTILGDKPEPRAATYLTDACRLTPALGNPPTIILGPGEPAMAHKTDEFCYVSRIEEAVDAYFQIGKNWMF